MTTDNLPDEMVLVPKEITEAQADCVGMPPSIWKKAIGVASVWGQKWGDESRPAPKVETPERFGMGMDGHDEPCARCGTKCNALSSDFSITPVCLWIGGELKTHCAKCVTAALTQGERPAEQGDKDALYQMVVVQDKPEDQAAFMVNWLRGEIKIPGEVEERIWQKIEARNHSERSAKPAATPAPDVMEALDGLDEAIMYGEKATFEGDAWPLIAQSWLEILIVAAKAQRAALNATGEEITPDDKKLTFQIERGETGLFYVTSPDIKGLLVAEKTWTGAIKAVPKALVDLEAALNGRAQVQDGWINCADNEPPKDQTDILVRGLVDGKISKACVIYFEPFEDRGWLCSRTHQPVKYPLIYWMPIAPVPADGVE